MKSKDIIILGHSGFIGQNLLNSYKNNKKIYLISRQKKTKNNREYQYDIFSDHRWFNLIKDKSTIFFLAFNNNLYELEKDKLYLKKIENFCENFKKHIIRQNIKVNIIFTSTVTIYGVTKKWEIINELYKDNPCSNYDLAKKVIEKNFLIYAKQGLVKFVSLRLSNIYGYGKNLNQKNRGFLNKLLKNIFQDDEIFIFGSGKKLRSYIHIEDLIKAIRIAKKNIKKLNGRIFILCGNKSYSFLDLIKISSKILGKKVRFKKKSFPKYINKIEKRSFVGNNKLFKKYTNWEPKIDLEKGISKVFWSLKKNEYNN